jgi:ATP-dependent exoDNAse (exonuclease V) beta subunit
LETILQKIADGEKPPEIDTASCPVVLSTVHGSKGLEYPMVILAMLEQDRSGIKDFIVEESSLGSSRVPLVGVRVEDPDKEYRRSKTLSGFLAEQQSKQLAASEAKRLFYVACTRAEEYLILALRKEKKEKEQPSDLSKAIRASQSPAGWLGMIAKRNDSGWIFDSGKQKAIEIPVT